MSRWADRADDCPSSRPWLPGKLRARSVAGHFALVFFLCALSAATDPWALPPAGERTLDQARHCGQAMVRPVQHVGLPGCQFRAGVMWNGALLLGPLESRDVKVISKN